MIIFIIHRYHKNNLFIIDVSQSVEHEHPHALEFLRKDCTNITSKFFNFSYVYCTVFIFFDIYTYVYIYIYIYFRKLGCQIWKRLIINIFKMNIFLITL